MKLRQNKKKLFNEQRAMWWNPPMESIATDFCDNTTIGGLKYLSKRNIHISERIFWIIAFLIGVGVCGALIENVYSRYSSNPVIVTFMSSEKHVGKIPFPALTICNMNMFPKAKVKELEEIVRQLSTGQLLNYNTSKTNNTIQEELTFAELICNMQNSFSSIFNYSFSRAEFSVPINTTLQGENIRGKLVNFLRSNTIPCDQVFHLCKWGGKNTNCSDLFRSTVTDFGDCCAFNVLPRLLMFKRGVRAEYSEEEISGWKEWDYAENWATLDDHIRYPRRQRVAGFSRGLSLLIDPNIDQYFCPLADSEGFRFVIHSPLERAQVFKSGAALSMEKEIFIRINPDIILADPGIKDFPKEKRECVLGDEIKLNMYQPYSKENCMDECVNDIIAMNCSCIPLAAASSKANTICAKEHDNCLEQLGHNLYTHDKIYDHCDHCKPLCEFIKYNYHTSVADLDNLNVLWKSFKTNGSEPNWAGHKMSIVHIFYDSHSKIPKVRKKMYSTVDLIANIGGLMGVCLGVSMVSVVENIYFFTMRLIWKTIRRKTLGYRVANVFFLAFQNYKSKQNIAKRKPKFFCSKTVHNSKGNNRIHVIDLDS